MTFQDMKKIGMSFRDGLINISQPVMFQGGFAVGRGRTFWLDGVNGSDANDGQTPARAVKTLTRAQALMTSDRGDTLFVIAGDTSIADTAQVTWSKDYCYVIGLAAPTPNARCKLTNSGTTAATAGVTVTAHGCVFTNLRFWEAANVATIGAFEVQGSQNYFYNCEFLGQVTANAAGGANAFSLFINGGSENRFERCQIGTDTVIRTDGAPLKLDGSAARNEFIECRFSSYCETAAKSFVKYVDVSALDRYLLFRNCWFYNFYVNHGAKLNEVFTIPASCATHDIILDQCSAVGVTQWAENDRGSIWVTGIAVQPS